MFLLLSMPIASNASIFKYYQITCFFSNAYKTTRNKKSESGTKANFIFYALANYEYITTSRYDV